MSARRIWLSPPHIGADEEALVRDAFRSNWIAPLGPHVDAFEADLCAVTHVSNAAVLSSGTAAIHLALILLNVGRDDVVICQDLTFSGTVNPVAYLGATPIFIDSENETWNMDPAQLRAAIVDSLRRGRKPKAIIPVHLYGMPAKMTEILAIAREFEIPVIEDAAESLGSTFKGEPCGGLGDIGILSFNGNKIVTTSGGGALLANDKALVERTRYLASQARQSAPHYQHTEIGYNYRMSNVLAAIGRGQLRHLHERVAARRANFERYREFLEDFEGITLLDEPSSDFFSNRWLTTILVDPAVTGGVTRETLRLALADADIEARPLWKPMHLQPVFERYPYFGSGTSDRLFDLGLCLPSGSDLTEEDFSRVAAVLGSVARRRTHPV